MFRLFKISKKNQDKIFNFFAWGFCVLLLAYWFVCGLSLQTNSAIISYNTKRVLKEDTKIEVNHVNEDNKVFLDDGSSYEDSEIKEYIKVAKGTGTYYIPDGLMTVEITKQDVKDLGIPFILMDIVVFIMFICLFAWKHKRKSNVALEIIGYLIVSFIASVVMKFWCVEIYKTAFPIQWVLYGRFLLYSVGVIVLYWYLSRRRLGV